MSLKKNLLFLSTLALLVISCMKIPAVLSIRQSAEQAQQRGRELREKKSIKLAPGLQMSLWATDTLAPDPVAMDIDEQGRVYITRTNRQKNSEFDIRGHRDWMTESIGFQTVDDRRAFLRKEFAPENSKRNEYLKDLNNDGSHDWRDLAVEQDEIWRIEDQNKDGLADVSTRILSDFNEEITDVAGGVLVHDKKVYVGIAPDLWSIQDKNGDGILDKKTSISTGYAVHIGFGGHGMSGVTMGPDGRVYWNIGDIGANVTSVEGKKFPNPNSGLIARSNPDGTDFEIFASGLRNTHEFAFDDYGNLISEDNDGDHPGERERLVHVVEGMDAGWRSNWQYGKYTDPKNNRYNVWMDEKMSVPRWEGQAAYILPPIQNYHNGPTGFVYNPGTALGKAWQNKFFVVEFVGSPSNSHIWSFGLKPKGASFVLDGETDMLSGILPTAIKFGPDGALYVADWVTGWDTKNYGYVWKLDVAPEQNDLAAQRKETQGLMVLDYSKQSLDRLGELLAYPDQRIRQKAQFELVKRGSKGLPILQKAIAQRTHQLARVNAIWGLGQLSRKDPKYASDLLPLLKDADTEIIVQAIKMLGDADVFSAAPSILPLLKHESARVQFYAAETLGLLKHTPALPALIELLEQNNDQDHYLRHSAVLALSRLGQSEPMVKLVGHPSKALRTAAVLVLRRLRSEKVALFLKDQDEYIVAEAARAINDDLSIVPALPALAEILAEKRFTKHALLRRAINAALRVGGEREMDLLIAYARRSDISDTLKAEALATLGTWASPSLTDRVDGRHRGKIERDPTLIRSKMQGLLGEFLAEKNPEIMQSVVSLVANLNLQSAAPRLAELYAEAKNAKIKAALLTALGSLQYSGIEPLIKSGMEDKEESVRTTALGLLNNSNVSKESLPAIVQSIFSKGGTREQQQLLVVLGKLDFAKTESTLKDLVAKAEKNELSAKLKLELQELINNSPSADLKARLAAIKPKGSPLDDFAEVLEGGNFGEGRNIFLYNSAAQCTRCHAVRDYGGNAGPNLSDIANTLDRKQLLQALIEPSARIAPGFGTVSLKLKDGQEVFGILLRETETTLSLKTSEAEPLNIPIARIASRENSPSSMPAMGEVLSKREIRDLLEFLGTLRSR
jgi:putative membrane-bound dehydrogenase-like protein